MPSFYKIIQWLCFEKSRKEIFANVQEPFFIIFIYFHVFYVFAAKFLEKTILTKKMMPPDFPVYLVL